MDLRGKILKYKYKISELLSVSGFADIYIAFNRLENNKRVVIKFLKKEGITNRKEDEVRFRNEAAGMSHINHQNIVKLIEFGIDDELNYMVMEPAEGKCLSDMTAEKETFSIADRTAIIMQMSDALVTIHSQGIVHKAVNPGNIIIYHDGTSLQGKLINYAIANIRDFSKITDRNDILRTFSYMSPEQSGIMRRKIDNRSDLYSLGIIFYELLTSELPFKGTDINSIIHQHIAVIAEPPREINGEIPEILGKIILKLIEKEPEKRYQSASTLHDDLEKYFSGDKDFMAGADDGIITQYHAGEMTGRNKEYEILTRELGLALSGKGRVCLISGEPGIGKTRLVEEFVNNIYYHAGTFITGSCTEGDNKIPYGPIKDIFKSYLENYLKYHEDKKAEISQQLEAKLASFAEIYITLQPMMSEIFSHAAPLEKLRPDREMQRFLMAIRSFFYELSRAEKGIVLIMDNLQWMDDNSFQLMKEIVKQISEYPLFIIGVYRNEEESESQLLYDFLNYLDINRYPRKAIQLMPFTDIAMNKFVAAMLHKTIIDTREISALVLNYSRGNPFFAMEVLKQFIDEKAISFQDNRLVIRMDIVSQMTILNTSLDIILKRISLFTEVEKEILSYASIIGMRFDMDTLFAITSFSDEDVISAVDKALDLQLLQGDTGRNGCYVFTDGSISEIFYQEISVDKLKVLHLKIARIMEYAGYIRSDSWVYDIARHFIEAGDNEKILEYAYPAGVKAMESHANEESLRLLGIVKNILEETSRVGDDFWIDIMKGIGDIYLRIGESDIAVTTFSVLLEYVEEKLMKTNIYHKISHAYFMMGDWRRCEMYARDGMMILGENIPVTKFSVISSLVAEVIRYYAGSFFKYRVHPKKENPDVSRYKVIINFYMTLDWMYALSDTTKLLRSVMRMLNISRKKIGESSELGMSMAVFASILMFIPFFKKAMKCHETALRIRRKLKDQYGIAQSMQYIGYSFCYQGDYLPSIRYFLESGEIFTRLGDVWEIAMVKNGLGYDHFYLGNYDEMVQCFLDYLDISEKINDFYGISVSTANLSLAYTHLGKLDKAEDFGNRAVTLSREKELWYPYCFANINYGILLMEKENYDEAVIFLETARRLFIEKNFIKDYTVYLFSCLAEVYIELYKSRGTPDLMKHIKEMCAESLAMTKSWPNHRAAAFRVCAKYYALIGRRKKAEWYFKKSIKHSVMYGRKFEMAKSLYEYGLFFLEKQKTVPGEARLKAAYQVFREINASLYIKKVENLLDITQEDTPSSIKTMIDKRRMYSIIQVSQDISSIMNLEVLLEKTMMAAIELMGAQSGALLLVNDDTGLLEVEVNKNVNLLHQNETKDFVNLIARDVFTSGKPILVMNAMEDEIYSKYPMVVQNGLKSIMCIPLIFKDEVMGVCYLDNPLSDSVFTSDDQDILMIIMTQAAISIQNVRLYELGITDGMTKLVTHDHFQNLLIKEISKSARFERELSLVMLDIDHFKIFNDTYGHQAGDDVLKSVSRIVKSCCREIDTAARYGGEELMLMLPETSLQKAEIVAERARVTIEEYKFIYQKEKLRVTVSIGVATYPLHAADGISLIKAADMALYNSKKNGRNKVSVYSGQVDDVISVGSV